MNARNVFSRSLAVTTALAACMWSGGSQGAEPNQPAPTVREGVLVEFRTRNLEDDWTVKALPEAPQDVIDDVHTLHEKVVKLVLSDEGFLRLSTFTSPNGRSILVIVTYTRTVIVDGKKKSHAEYSTHVWRDWRSPDNMLTFEGRWQFISNNHVGMFQQRQVIRRGGLGGERKRQIRSLDDPDTQWSLDWTAAVADDGSAAFREGEFSKDYVIVVGKLASDGSFREEVRYARNQIDRTQSPNLFTWLNGGEFLLITVGQVQEGWSGPSFIRVLDRKRKLLSIKLRGVAYPKFILNDRNFLVIRKDEGEFYSLTEQGRLQHRGTQRGYSHDRHPYTCSPSGDLAIVRYGGVGPKKMTKGIYYLDRFDKGPIEEFSNRLDFQGWLTWDAP